MSLRKTGLIALALAGCAAPAAKQGESNQGGSTGLAPVVTVNVTFQGDVKVDSTSVPTAAPASSSDAQATQTATADVKPTAAVGDSAIDAIKPIPTIGSLVPPKPEAPEPPK